MRTNLCASWAHNWSLGARILAVCLGFKYLFSASNTNKVINIIKWFWICLLIFYFSLLKYTYHYNYRSHISLQVAKLAKSAGGPILIFPTVYVYVRHSSLLPHRLAVSCLLEQETARRLGSDE